MKTVQIVGVPEHFNLPWNLCIDNGEFNEVGIDLQWTDVPEGSGKMCQLLRDNQADIAVILTEAIIKDIEAGNPAVLVQNYIQTPLIWGIHVDANSPFKTLADLENKRAAISRFGSGSHLMSVVHADQQNWDTQKMEFVVVNTLDGAVSSMQNNASDFFMWERFMTKPLVDQGVFRHLGDCPTPWPCFVIAVNKTFLENNKHVVDQILEIINRTSSEFKHIPSIDQTIASKFDIDKADVNLWLSKTRWSQKKLDKKHFDLVQDYLYKLQLIKNKMQYNNVVI